MKDGTLTLRNIEQVVLFKHEICGQLSDGQWENTRPLNHWKPWGRCEVIVGTAVGRDFYAGKDNYNLNNSELLDIIGQRMITAVRIARHFGEEVVHDLMNLFNDNQEFKGMPTYEGKFYDELRQRLAQYDFEVVKSAVLNDSYGMKQLRADLKDMKASFKIRT